MSNVQLKNPKGEVSNMDDVKGRYIIMDTGVSYALIPTHDFEAITTSLS